MAKLRIDWNTCPKNLAPGLREIAADRPGILSNSPTARTLRFIHDNSPTRPTFSITHDKNSATIRYSRLCDAFRALGHLLGEAHSNTTPKNLTQSCPFDLLGIKLDCSRNGVANLHTLKTLLRHAALLGFNTFSLYLEDTYEIPGEPFFGYLRGGYSQKDLKALDDYAFMLGIECLPSTQILGHVEQILQWPAYADLQDQPAVFLANHEPTYALIEKMLTAVTKPFRSKRIFPGMDEAHGLGAGRYQRLFGPKPSFEIFHDHMRRVCKICRKLGLKPTTSADMYFRLGSRDNWYYDEDAVVPPEIIARIPSEIQIAYWDYYHTDTAFYERWIDRHRALGKEPMMVSGIWTWNHFWAHHNFSVATIAPMMTACRKKGLREIFCTLWGDDGMECDPFSALPGLACFAQHAYAGHIDPKALRNQFLGATAEDCYDDYVHASDIDLLNHRRDMHTLPDNPSVWLLWEDPALGLLEPQVTNRKLPDHHRLLATALDKAAAKPGPLARRLRFPAQIARVLSLKIDLHRKLAAALRAGDKRAVRTLRTRQLEPLRRQVDRLWIIHRQMWLDTYNPFGLEVLEARYGALHHRLATLSDRLADYLSGQIPALPEVTARLHKIFPQRDIYKMIRHARAATPSMIK